MCVRPKCAEKMCKKQCVFLFRRRVKICFMLDHVGADLQHIHSCTTKLAGGSSINDRVSAVVKKMFPTVKLHISIWLIPFTDMV